MPVYWQGKAPCPSGKGAVKRSQAAGSLRRRIARLRAERKTRPWRAAGDRPDRLQP
jgi:hypothetical protein